MKRQGITLTEILVVVIILSVLVAFSYPVLIKTLEKARVNEAVANLELIRAAQKRYFLQSENGTFTPNMDDLHIEEHPDTPSTRFFDYTIESGTATDFTARAQRRSDGPSPYNGYYYEISKEGICSSNGPFI